MTEASDTELLTRMQARDTAAFEMFIRRYDIQVRTEALVVSHCRQCNPQRPTYQATPPRGSARPDSPPPDTVDTDDDTAVGILAPYTQGPEAWVEPAERHEQLHAAINWFRQSQCVRRFVGSLGFGGKRRTDRRRSEATAIERPRTSPPGLHAVQAPDFIYAPRFGKNHWSFHAIKQEFSFEGVNTIKH